MPAPPNRISVIIPCWNAAPYLEQAVESLFATGYPNLEVVIVDDGSSDHSREIARDLARRHPSVRPVAHRHHAHRGVGRTLNYGARLATGNYLAFLGADDYVYPNRFAQSAEILDRSPEVDAVCGTTQRVVDPGGEWRAPRVREQTVFDCEDPEAVLEQRLFGGLAWSANAILMRTRIFAAVGGFSRLRIAQDAVLWLKLACVARIVSAGLEPICVYRIHAANHSSSLFTDRFRPVNSRVVAEALAWARRHSVPPAKIHLLEKALVVRVLGDNRQLRASRQFASAGIHLAGMLARHPFLLAHSTLRRCVACTVLEGLRLRQPAFSATHPGSG